MSRQSITAEKAAPLFVRCFGSSRVDWSVRRFGWAVVIRWECLTAVWAECVRIRATPPLHLLSIPCSWPHALHERWAGVRPLPIPVSRSIVNADVFGRHYAENRRPS